MKRVQLQPGFVLHRRAYRETSFLVEIFTPEYGRLTLIAKGVRKAKPAIAGLLQPFIPLQFSWVGRAELMTLTEVEVLGQYRELTGNCLIAGFYLNELLMYLLHKWDAHQSLYQAYAHTIAALQCNEFDERILRSFEKFLLESLGYGLFPKNPQLLAQQYPTHSHYRYLPEQGLVLSDEHLTTENCFLFSGEILQDIALERWHEASLYAAKQLTRLILSPLLGNKTLNSRQLFQHRGTHT